MPDTQILSSLRFWNYAEEDRTKLAIVGPDDRRWSRGEVIDAANKLSSAMAADLLKRGDVIAILAPNCAEYLIVYLAATQMGLYVVPVSYYLSHSELAWILEDAKPDLLFYHESVSNTVGKALARPGSSKPKIVMIGKGQDSLNLEAYAGSHSSESPSRRATGRVLAYTSATTGKPKAVELSLDEAEHALNLAIQLRIQGGLKPEHDVHLLVSMLYHPAPLEGVVVTLHMGNSVVLIERNGPEEILGAIARHRVTTAFMVPTNFINMLSLDDAVRSRYETGTLRKVTHTGVGCPLEVKRRMIDWWGPILLEAYGGVEGGGTVVTSEEWLRFPGTVGRPIQGSAIRIMDEEGRDLPAGVVGDIYLKRYTGDCFRYRGEEEKTRACHRGEFFTLGDVGYLNQEGYLFLCDRKIDMIITAGNNIYCAEVEQAIRKHRQVEDCAVFGIPHESLGETVNAVIQLSGSGAPTTETTASIRKVMGEHIAPWKVPLKFFYVKKIPRNALGKINKKILGEQYASVGDRSTLVQ